MLEAVKISPSIVIYVSLIFALYLINSWHIHLRAHTHAVMQANTDAHSKILIS